MKFALLGADDESCLLTQVATDLGHEIVWCGDVAAVDRAKHPWLVDADQASQWETLYDGQFCDFVIVGRGRVPPDRRVEQLIQLVKNGVAVLTSYPLSESVLSYYEIDMARNESDSVLHHYNPLVAQAHSLSEFHGWLVAGHPQLGRIEQLICERPLAERTRAADLWHFARDVELLDNIAGPLDQLGAHGSPNEDATYAGLSVHLLGRSQVPVRWSVGPIDQSAWPILTFVGEQGRVRFAIDDAGELHPAEVVELDSQPPHAANDCMRQFTAAVAGAEGPKSTWPAALRAMELTDTIEISLRRGRMIEVHRQQLTEELSFRGAMSAVGCGLLLLLPPLLVLVGWVAELMGLPVAEYWAHLLLTLLALFLLLQFAPKLLIKKRDSH